MPAAAAAAAAAAAVASTTPAAHVSGSSTPAVSASTSTGSCTVSVWAKTLALVPVGCPSGGSKGLSTRATEFVPNSATKKAIKITREDQTLVNLPLHAHTLSSMVGIWFEAPTSVNGQAEREGRLVRKPCTPVRIESEQGKARREKEARVKEEAEERAKKDEDGRKKQEEEEGVVKEKREEEERVRKELDKKVCLEVGAKAKAEEEERVKAAEVAAMAAKVAVSRRPIASPLDLKSAVMASAEVAWLLSSAQASVLLSVRPIKDITAIQHPAGTRTPNPDLNATGPPEHGSHVPAVSPLAGGLLAVRRSGGIGGKVGLGITNGAGATFGGKPGFSMGNLQAPARAGADGDRLRSVSALADPGGGGRQRTSCDRQRPGSRQPSQAMLPSPHQYGMEPIEPFTKSGNRWKPQVTMPRGQRAPEPVDTPEMVKSKVKALLNNLTLEKFDSISDQIMSFSHPSEQETDGHMLMLVTKLVFEKATDKPAWSEMYAHLCRKMMELINPKVFNVQRGLERGCVQR
ncbi:hypothetical protein CALVIDRAFT_525728, partial [Calocera viscosa TUFC12733]